MPFCRQYKIGDTELLLWHVTEIAEEMARFVSPVCVAECAGFVSERRRCEWLAVRALLAMRFGDGVRVVYDGAGKPALDGVSYDVSISHTAGYVVLALSGSGAVGVDVELLSRNALVASERYIPSNVLDSFPLEMKNTKALFHWCAKEALFKLVGNLGGTFRENISLGDFEIACNGSFRVSVVGLGADVNEDFIADYMCDGELLFVVCRRCKACLCDDK